MRRRRIQKEQEKDKKEEKLVLSSKFPEANPVVAEGPSHGVHFPSSFPAALVFRPSPSDV